MAERSKTTKKATTKGSSEFVHDTLDLAMVAAQSELRNTKKDSVNPHFKSRYTQLSTLLEDVEPVLNKHGVYVTTTSRCSWSCGEQRGDPEDMRILETTFSGHVLTCTLVHGSTGHARSSETFIAPQKGPQPFGAYMTYMRRYLIQGLVGVAEGNDDDGESQQQEYRSQGSERSGSGGGNGQLRSAVTSNRRGR